MTSTPSRTHAVPDPAAGQAVRAADRAHVFHSWSAQGLIDPLAVAGAEGSYFWDYDGNRYLDFSSQLVNTNIGHQHPKVVAAIQEQAGRMCTFAPGLRRRRPRRGRTARSPSAPPATSTRSSSPTAAPRPSRTPSAWPGCTPAAPRCCPPTARTTAPPPPRSTSPATRAAGPPTPAPPASCTSGPAPLPLALPRRDRGAGVRSARWPHLEETIAFEGPRTIAAIILETVPGTAGDPVPPPGYLAGVREICDRYGIVFILDEVMAGFGRTGTWFAADHFDVDPGPDDLRQGRQLRLRPAGRRRHLRRDRRDLRPAALPRRTHLLRPSRWPARSAVATINAMAEEGIVENAARIGENVIGPALRELAERHPSVGEVRGMGVFWALDLVRNEETREPLVPYNASGADNAPMAEFAAACKRGGLWPFVNMNRTHVVPPCTITEAEAKEGLAVLDEALTVADAHTGARRPGSRLSRLRDHADDQTQHPARADRGRAA